jgi:hypothetical protein
MPAAADFQRERRELASLLASNPFTRAPNLASLLAYVCQKYFEGEADELKEYSLAVEALGRPTDFDNKKDSVVRVEVHRLRKRLREYYDGEGANHPVQIVIPPGQYAPHFVYQDEQALVAAANGSAPVTVLQPDVRLELDTVQRPRAVFSVRLPLTRRRWLWIAAGVAGVAALLVVVGLRWPGTQINAARVRTDSAFTTGDEVRILAGSEQWYEDSFGRKWSPDRFFTGGAVFTEPNHQIFATRDPKIYRTRREGAFKYDIPLKPGTYELRLHFAETLFGESNIAAGGETTRIFGIKANGKSLLEAMDVISDSGPSTADVRVFKDLSPDRDGILHLQFDPVTNVAFLNGIEITPGTPNRLRPIRIVARDHPYTDKQGRVWEPDHYAKGGQLVMRADTVAETADPEIYRGERFGNMTYSIPVAPGRYALILHFAETWFGPSKPGKGGPGDRQFDVLCNGTALIRNLDIYKEAGGGYRALTKTFHNIEPTSQGRLEIGFMLRKNYASINAIEVIDESR